MVWYGMFRNIEIFCLGTVQKLHHPGTRAGGGQPKDDIGLCGGRGVKQKMMDDDDERRGGRRRDHC